ncbi:MAG TPA: tagatose-6-phosphate ketose isomerase [Rudaea sp.]|nr:tagatose-6-phosphate ketose isomerase [Rudaea sp.]
MTVNPSELGSLLARNDNAQRDRGYLHTLSEILQQPASWVETSQALAKAIEAGDLHDMFDPQPDAIVFTGSGSSNYVGECLATGLQAALNLPVQAIAAGTLLTHLRGTLAPGRGLLVSIARSGDSPESAAVVDKVLAEVPQYRHLIITCNARGRLATRYRDDPRVAAIVLDERTNDRSLVMTSSFTNLLLAGRALAWMQRLHMYTERATRVAALASRVIERDADSLAAVARSGFFGAVYLGSGVRFGSARESALKMLEMSAGRVQTSAETFLGLRHGPLAAVDADTLVVAFLSCDATVRAFEHDVLRELDRKGLGTRRVLVGDGIPGDLLRPGQLAVEIPGLAALGDDDAPLLDVLVGQLLAFFNCLHLGFKPDAPSQGVLTRVVEEFSIHRSPA